MSPRKSDNWVFLIEIVSSAFTQISSKKTFYGHDKDSGLLALCSTGTNVSLCLCTNVSELKRKSTWVPAEGSCQ